MPIDREALEKLLADLRGEREEAEAVGSRAAERLVRLAAGHADLSDVDAAIVRSAAEDFATAVEKLKLLKEWTRRVRGLLT